MKIEYIKKTCLHTVLILVIGVFLNACGLSTDQLSREIKRDIIKVYKEDGLDIKVLDFELTHKGDNEYLGILDVEEEDGVFRYSVDVVYDGASFVWEIGEDYYQVEGYESEEDSQESE